MELIVEILGTLQIRLLHLIMFGFVLNFLMNSHWQTQVQSVVFWNRQSVLQPLWLFAAYTHWVYWLR